MPPAARITDLHTCPMTTGPVPHVGGPILPPGAPTVLINFLPAATVTSMATCVGPPDVIVKGSAGVFINYKPAARMGDMTAHGGVIVLGSPDVIIGEIGPPSPGASGAGAIVSGLALSGVSKAATPVTVTKISGVVAGTHGKRDATKKRPSNHLKPSSSSSEDLTANPPIVLVRGCLPVTLTATTTPPHSTVTWQVKPNQNSNAAPAISPASGGNKATLQTGNTGSFSVIATAGSTKVVWNIVFVSVEVDAASSHVITRNNYIPSGAGGFASGNFVPNQQAWEAKVTVNLVGGGSDGKLGLNKIKLKVLQNGVADTLTGHYAAPPPNSTAREQPIGGLPIVDANDGSQPFVYFANSATFTKISATKWKVWTGDAPAGGFPIVHQNTGQPLQSISGINGFSTAIASVSDDARTEIMVHAALNWQAHFDGTINAAGVYTANGAHTSSASQYHLISAGTGGQDACSAGFETFEPRFNGGTNTLWNP